MITTLSAEAVRKSIAKFTADLIEVAEEIAETDHPGVLAVNLFSLTEVAENLGLAYAAGHSVKKRISGYDFDSLQIDYLEMRILRHKAFKGQMLCRLQKEPDPEVVDFYRTIIHDAEQSIVSSVAALDQIKAQLQDRTE